MIVDEQTQLEDCATPIDSLEARQFRSVTNVPDLIRSSLRRVVHDYVTGWGIVLSQTPRERRRKKRLWDRRTSERQAFRRPVWVHKAHWGECSPHESRPLLVDPHDVLYLVHDLSAAGIGLTSDSPPKSRLVVLKFDSWQGLPVEIVVQLRWRKRVGPHHYRCGGTILGVLTPE
jgi:hypothetical protein